MAFAYFFPSSLTEETVTVGRTIKRAIMQDDGDIVPGEVDVGFDVGRESQGFFEGSR